MFPFFRLDRRRMRRTYLISLIVFILFSINTNANYYEMRNKRSIELSSAQKLITDNRLSKEIEPVSYILELHPDMESSSFAGIVKINITWKAETKIIELHSHHDLQIDESKVLVRLLNPKIRYV